MQEIAQLPVKTKLALFLSFTVTVLFAFVFVQQAVGFNNAMGGTPITPPVTPPHTATPVPSASPTATPSASPKPSPSVSPAPSPTPTPGVNTPPQINLLLGNTIHTRINKRLTWTFMIVDSNRDTVKVTTTKLPKGLQLECKKEGHKKYVQTCKIQGTPTQTGTTSVTITATDSKGATDTEIIQIIVTPKK